MLFRCIYQNYEWNLSLYIMSIGVQFDSFSADTFFKIKYFLVIIYKTMHIIINITTLQNYLKYTTMTSIGPDK